LFGDKKRGNCPLAPIIHAASIPSRADVSTCQRKAVAAFGRKPVDLFLEQVRRSAGAPLREHDFLCKFFSVGVPWNLD
jgi:hypothetical protein